MREVFIILADTILGGAFEQGRARRGGGVGGGLGHT